MMLVIEIKSSRILTILLVLAHAASVAVAWVLALAPVFKLALTGAIVASGWWYVRRDALLAAPCSPQRLQLYADGKLALICRDGRQITATVVSGSVVTPRFTVLAYRPDGGRRRRYVPIVVDMLDGEAFRRLRVHLKWRGTGRLLDGDDRG